MTRVLAPPCSGPFSVPIAETTAEYMSERVAAVTRAEKVEAFMPCSAWSTSAASKVRTRSSSASSPLTM
jgi:hypothetical protein